jgi:phosphohistidine phosphatase SixA
MIWAEDGSAVGEINKMPGSWVIIWWELGSGKGKIREFLKFAFFRRNIPVHMPTIQVSALPLSLLFCLLFSQCDTTQPLTQDKELEQPTTIIMVRHAEKDYGDDPNLTEPGRERANLLRDMLKDTELAAVYSTDFKRTMQTAEPVAKEKELDIRVYSPQELSLLATQLVRRHRGETVLVVGHSNTTPALASHLDPNAEYPRFSELDYTNLYIMSIPQQGDPKLLKLRF